MQTMTMQSGSVERFSMLPSASKQSAVVAAVVLLLANVMDAGMTLFWLERGLAREANPLMERLLAHSQLAFFGVKYLLVALAVALLLRLQRSSFARQALFGSSAAYCALIGYHLSAVVG